jgi:hypothetical protein
MPMFKRALLRCIRSSVVTAIAGSLASVSANPRWLFLVPVIQTLGKILRERFPKAAPWITF